MAEKTKTGCVKKFFAIPEPLNDRLTQAATTECRSQTQIFVRALEYYLDYLESEQPSAHARTLDPARIQTRYYDYGLGMSIK